MTTSKSLASQSLPESSGPSWLWSDESTISSSAAVPLVLTSAERAVLLRPLDREDVVLVAETVFSFPGCASEGVGAEVAPMAVGSWSGGFETSAALEETIVNKVNNRSA